MPSARRNFRSSDSSPESLSRAEMRRIQSLDARPSADLRGHEEEDPRTKYLSILCTNSGCRLDHYHVNGAFCKTRASAAVGSKFGGFGGAIKGLSKNLVVDASTQPPTSGLECPVKHYHADMNRTYMKEVTKLEDEDCASASPTDSLGLHFPSGAPPDFSTWANRFRFDENNNDVIGDHVNDEESHGTSSTTTTSGISSGTKPDLASNASSSGSRFFFVDGLHGNTHFGSTDYRLRQNKASSGPSQKKPLESKTETIVNVNSSRGFFNF